MVSSCGGWLVESLIIYLLGLDSGLVWLEWQCTGPFLSLSLSGMEIRMVFFSRRFLLDTLLTMSSL
jgi:hypothetical protein